MYFQYHIELGLVPDSSIFHSFVTAYYISSLYKFIYMCVSQPKRKKEKEKEKTKSITHIYDACFGTSGPARHVGHATEKKRKDKKKEKRGEEGIQGDPLHATGSSMLVVSLWVEEGGWLRVEIVEGTWVGDAHDVGAGGCCHRQDLATVWPVRLLAKREWGRVRTVFGCMLRGCTDAQDWEKRKEKTKKEKRNADSLKAYTSASCHWPFDADSLFVGRRAWSVAC